MALISLDDNGSSEAQQHHADKRLHGLDHLRAFAISYVLVYHYGGLFPHPQWVARVSDFGWTGVDLFFVLSGYLIGGQLLRTTARGQRILIGEFYLKRFFRIVPAYLVVVAIYLLIPGVREFGTIAPLWKFLTFTQNLGMHPETSRAFSHAWSLCVEEHFYLLLPILLMALTARRSSKMTACAAGSIFVGGVIVRGISWLIWDAADKTFPSWMEWIYYPTYTRLDGLLVGVCAAGLQCYAPSRWDQLTRRWHWLAALGLALLVGAQALLTERTSFGASVFLFPLIAVAYGCLLIAAVSPRSFMYRTSLTLTSIMATLSYSLYLTHKAVIHVTQAALSPMGVEPNSNFMFVLALITSLASAWLLHVAIEQPFMRLRSRLVARPEK
jgi:peptidoglycan/LPS O-acetylase OafA/YrhL